MASSKEYDGILFDQLEIIEEALSLLKEEDAPKTMAYLEKKKKYVERKLYRNPPLLEEDDEK
ncbi:MAG: hypothetical protein IJ679_05280 [Lachnospiraceae bacterium]|nr:hypothetical protein [Lachnospiraceae bacterium]